MKMKMTKIFLAALAACVMTVSAHAQVNNRQDKASQGKIYDQVEQMPTFPGGTQEFFNYFGHEMKYPKDAFEKKISGKVVVDFVVEKDGSISNVKINKSIYPSLDAEAKRVVEAMPKWNPGKQDGKLVRVKFTMPVSFSLD